MSGERIDDEATSTTTTSMMVIAVTVVVVVVVCVGVRYDEKAREYGSWTRYWCEWRGEGAGGIVSVIIYGEF